MNHACKFNPDDLTYICVDCGRTFTVAGKLAGVSRGECIKDLREWVLNKRMRETQHLAWEWD